MPEPLTSYITTWRDLYQTISADIWTAGNALKQAGAFLKLGDDSTAGDYLDAAGDQLHVVSNEFHGNTDSLYNDMYDALHWIDDNIGGGVDMDAIINAMLQANFNQLEKFIGIVDAYRVALWNAPFNHEFYAALARGFEKWPQY